MSKLSKDILYLIFEELQGDSKSLFSCLLVNRLWCEVAVPILWKDPWCSIIKDFNHYYPNKSSLHYIFTLFSSDNINKIPHRPLLFDYLSFCKSINANVINKLVSIYSSSASDQYHFQQEIYVLLMRKCSTLQYLDMRSLKLQIFLLPEATNRLESLCELKCNTSIESLYLYTIARICQNIQRLIILNTSMQENEGLVSLIEAQRNLKYFEWEETLGEYYTNDCYMKIFGALKKKADTLSYFIHNNNFDNVRFFVNILSNVLLELYNLKVLKLNFADYLEYPLRFQHLEVLQIDNIKIKKLNLFIRSSGGRLKKILFKNLEFTINDIYGDALSFIRIVHENCPLIEYLSLMFITIDEHFIELERLLRTCQKLKVLILEVFNVDSLEYQGMTNKETHLASGKEILNVLIRSAPINLSVFGIFYYFIFSINNLEEFLENWKGRSALSIITSNNEYENEEYTKLIDKYKDNGVKFRIIDDFRNLITIMEYKSYL